MMWLELAVDVDPEAVETISELLAQFGYNGGVVIDQPIISGADGTEYVYDMSRPVTLRTYLPLDEQADQVRSQVEQALWHVGQMRPVGPLRVQQLEEQDWADAWKQHYTIQRVGERTVIVPSWLVYDPLPDDVVLRLDPGMAFGTGLHPTTQLCLVALERYVKSDMTVIDLGCGSGILSIAAALLGARAVLALDTDAIAVAATRENVERNGVASRVEVREGSLGGGAGLGHWIGWSAFSGDGGADAGHFRPPGSDVVVANIIARVIVALAGDLAQAVLPGGVLITSGIICDYEEDVVSALEGAQLTMVERHQEGDWLAFVHRRVSVV